MDYTPETLRGVVSGNLSADMAILDHAAAWEKLQDEYNGLTDIADGFYKRVIELVAENDNLTAHIGVLEREIPRLVASVCDGTWGDDPDRWRFVETISPKKLVDALLAALAPNDTLQARED